jgi:polyhydroxyalkanoate synthesis regulator protein
MKTLHVTRYANRNMKAKGCSHKIYTEELAEHIAAGGEVICRMKYSGVDWTHELLLTILQRRERDVTRSKPIHPKVFRKLITEGL